MKILDSFTNLGQSSQCLGKVGLAGAGKLGLAGSADAAPGLGWIGKICSGLWPGGVLDPILEHTASGVGLEKMAGWQPPSPLGGGVPAAKQRSGCGALAPRSTPSATVGLKQQMENILVLIPPKNKAAKLYFFFFFFFFKLDSLVPLDKSSIKYQNQREKEGIFSPLTPHFNPTQIVFGQTTTNDKPIQNLLTKNKHKKKT
jgi:hypothetical protein